MEHGAWVISHLLFLSPPSFLLPIIFLLFSFSSPSSSPSFLLLFPSSHSSSPSFPLLFLLLFLFLPPSSPLLFPPPLLLSLLPSF